MKELFAQKIKTNPLIAAVKDLKKLDQALDSKCEIIFLLNGNIFNLKENVEKAHQKNKLVFIHIDLIDGFSKDLTALKFIHQEIKPDGIISTKNNQIKNAKELGLLTVQRLFIIDSLSIETTVKTSRATNPDAVEIMPGIMPKITTKLSERISIPIIAGGLISEKEEIISALSSGGFGVSSTESKLWNLKF